MCAKDLSCCIPCVRCCIPCEEMAPPRCSCTPNKLTSSSPSLAEASPTSSSRIPGLAEAEMLAQATHLLNGSGAWPKPKHHKRQKTSQASENITSLAWPKPKHHKCQRAVKSNEGLCVHKPPQASGSLIRLAQHTPARCSPTST